MSYCRSYKLGSAVQCAVQCSAVQWWYSELTAVSRGRWTTANGKRLLQWLALTAHKQAELSVGRSRSFIVIIFFFSKKKSLRICTGPSDSFIDQTKCAPTVGPVGPVPMIFLRYCIDEGVLLVLYFLDVWFAIGSCNDPLLPSSSVRVIVLIDSKK